MPKKPIYRQLKNFSKEKSDVPVLISGTLGVQINGQKTVEVLGRDGFVWVKLRDSQSELIQVYNAVVSPIYGLPVLVTRQNNRYTIYGRDINQYQDWGNSPYLPKHGTQHSFAPEIGLGGDVTWVYSRQFMPMLVMPSGSVGAGNLIVNPYIYHNTSGTFSYIGNTGTPIVTVAKPTNNTARMMLLYWDEPNGRPSFYTGSTFSSLLTGSSDIVPYIPYLNDTTKIPLAAIRLVSGTSNITWDNIYDVRPFFSAAISGGGTGNITLPATGTVVVWDEGALKGSVSTLNFVGNSIDVSVSGSVARVFVTGSTSAASSYDNFWTSGSAGVNSICSKNGLNNSNGDYSFSVGNVNSAGGFASSVLGGQNNIASGTYSAVVAGWSNYAKEDASAVLAGQQNTVLGLNSSILAGNSITGSVDNTAYTQFFNTRLRSGTLSNNVGIDSGGFLVTGSLSFAENNTNDIFRVNSPGGTSVWTGTISGTPSGTFTTVSAPTSGTEGVLVPASTSQLAKMRVYNLTRGNYALISNYNTVTNVITHPTTPPANWANGDSLTVASQTVSGGGLNWIDLEVTSGPINKNALWVNLQINSGAAGDAMRLHPFDASLSSAKYSPIDAQAVGVTQNAGSYLLKIISNLFCIAWTANSTALVIREAGWMS
jgi:hypothetical protein